MLPVTTAANGPINAQATMVASGTTTRLPETMTLPSSSKDITAAIPALVAAVSVLVAAAASTWVQFRFRIQARRGQFRRRQTSSRIATFAEALSSIGWAATSSLAVLGLWLAIVPGTMTLMMLGAVWAFSPGRA